MAGFAAQFGMDVGASAAGESLQFYAALLKSRELLRQVALSQYLLPASESSGERKGTLAELYGADASTREGQVSLAIAELRARTSIASDLQTGLITVETSAPSPELAVQVNRRLLALVNEFNVERRQSQAAAERRFIENRLQKAQADLKDAEAALESFLRQNRRFQGSAPLMFREALLQRRVELLHQIYVSIAQAYERARMDEVRNTPVITIVDEPSGSVRDVNAPGWLTAILAFFLGTVLAAWIAFLREYLLRKRSSNPAAYEEFLTLSHALLPKGRGRVKVARPQVPAGSSS